MNIYNAHSFYQVNKTVLTVLAEDNDLGLYGEVVYSLAPPTSRAQPFSVHPHSGDVRLSNRSLDYEQRQQYRLTLTATDRSTSDPRSSSVPLHLTVLDRNDNYPILTVNTFNGGQGGGGGDNGGEVKPVIAMVAENKDSDSFLAHVTCSDADSGVNGQVECHVVNSLDFRLQRLADEQYKFVTAKPLDRESYRDTSGTDDVYVMAKIRCTDKGQPSTLSSEVRVKVKITDENDNSPIFKRKSYTFRIDEDMGTSVGVTSRSVGRVGATDEDGGVYGMIRYSFSSPQSHFRINATDGTIVTRGRRSGSGDTGVLDYEHRRLHRLMVVAADGGGAETRVQVNVQLADLNDNPPRFSWSRGSDVIDERDDGRPLLTLRIAENLKPGVILTTLNITDADRDPRNRRHRFELVQTDVDQSAATTAAASDLSSLSPVNVHPTTGEVSTSAQFDRETKTEYRFVIRAYDPFKTERLFDTINCVLLIEDRNDNPPVLSTPTDIPGSGDEDGTIASVVVRVSSYLPLGDVVYKVRASDPDIDDVLTYSIAPSPSLSPSHVAFVVDKNSGVVTSARMFHDEVATGVKEFRYQIEVVDEPGTGGNLVKGQFTVIVDASLPYPPTTTHATRDARNARNRHIAVVVGIVVATVLVVAFLSAAILVLRRRETRDRKRPVGDTGNSAWQLPLSIEKVFISSPRIIRTA